MISSTRGLVIEVAGQVQVLARAVVRDTVAVPEITPAPGVAYPIVGLAQVHGRVVPVLDLGGRARRTRRGALVIVEVDGLRVALRVDAVRGEEPAAQVLDVARLVRELRAGGGRREQDDLASGLAPDETAREEAIRVLLGEDFGDLRALFLDEAAQHLDAAEGALARLESDTRDRAAHATLLRELHTLKGSAGAVGLESIAATAHRIEDRALALRGDAAGNGLAQVNEALAHLRIALARVDRGARAGGASSSGEAGHAGASVRQAQARGSQTAVTATAEEPPHVRVGVEQIDALMQAATNLVQDRTRIARRLPDLEAAGRELERAGVALSAGTGGTDGGAAHADAAAAVEAARQRLAGTIALLVTDVESLSHTSRVFQHGLRDMRMLEAGRLFAQLAGSVRELARRQGRQVEVRVVGAATLIDKAVAERLADSLLHLLRNALAHGLEPPAERIAAGKPAAGHIELSARQRGDEILLEVADDGAGVDGAAVRRALVRAGVVEEPEATALSDAQVLEAIFEPGISTRPDAGDLAGRGVGLDAVKDAIGRLGGAISCSSRPGQGMRFTVRLPLTAAIVRALLFKVAGQVYAVPASSVVHVTSAGDSSVPRVDVATLLGGAAAAAGGAAVGSHEVLLEHEGTRFAATVDRVIGEREIVVKGLGALFAAAPLYAGATISGAGKVQLLLDVAELAARSGAATALPAAAADTAAASRILVVDDSATARAALCAVLRTARYHVEEASDGIEALERLSATRPDILVTDVEMPRLDGFGLIERMRTVASLRDLPVIVVSSRGSAARDRALSLGAAFLDKPTPSDELLAAVDHVLRTRPAP